VSFQQAVDQAVRSAERMRALFGDDPHPGSGAAAGAVSLRQAHDQTTVAGVHMAGQSGAVKDAHGALVARSAAVLRGAATADVTLSGYLNQAAAVSAAGATRLDTIAAQIRAIAALAPTARTPAAQRTVLAALHGHLSQGQGVVNGAKQQSGGIAGGVRALDYGVKQAPPPALPPPSPDPAQRRQNQIEAFRRVFGRDPVSRSDWTTASVLDPHSYDPKNQGRPPNIVLGRIRPVPGQGVVRTNLFIPGEKAWTPFGDNLGDHRGFDPTAGPEASRVTIYTDYDNGVVVARQNPSVLQGPGGAQVETGHPDIQVSQNPNGSVRIQYRAADPFSPGGEDLAKSTPWNVNGDYVIKPTPAGPIVGGNISEFPAVEIYNDNGTHTTDLGHIMPQNTSVFGPLAGLPLSQQIGPGLMGEFPDTMLPGTVMPTPPPLPGASHTPPVLRIPVPVVIPYPSVALGPVGSIPQVPVGQ
jgi:hypothetical protein